MAYGDYGRSTELEAVNICLGVIGEQPVDSVPESGISKATLARDILYELSREVQLEGLACNTDTEYELTPNATISTLTGVSISNADPSVLTKVENAKTIDDNLAIGDGVIVNSGTNSIPGTYVVVSIVPNVSVTLDGQAADGACTDGNITYYDVGEITLPATALNVDPSYLYDNRFVERSGKLYDTVDQTFTITKNIKVDIIWFLEWTDLPEHVRRYILIRAARVFQKRFLADENLHRFTIEDEQTAKRQFSRKELNIADCSILDNVNVNPRFYRRG